MKALTPGAKVPDSELLLEPVREQIVRQRGFRGLSVTGYDATMGTQFAIIAKDAETLRIMWNRLGMNAPIIESGIQKVIIVGDHACES